MKKFNSSLESSTINKSVTSKFMESHKSILVHQKFPNIDWSSHSTDTVTLRFYSCQLVNWYKNQLVKPSNNSVQDMSIQFLCKKWDFININGKKVIFWFGIIGKSCIDHQAILMEEDYFSELKGKNATIDFALHFNFTTNIFNHKKVK